MWERIFSLTKKEKWKKREGIFVINSKNIKMETRATQLQTPKEKETEGIYLLHRQNIYTSTYIHTSPFLSAEILILLTILNPNREQQKE